MRSGIWFGGEAAHREVCRPLGHPADKRAELILPHSRQAPRPTTSAAAQSRFDLNEICGGEAHCLTVESARQGAC